MKENKMEKTSFKPLNIEYVLLVISVVVSTTFADVTVGENRYFVTCKYCHGPIGANMHTQKDWDNLFADNAANIIQAHNRTKAELYFNNGLKGHAKDLHDYLNEYASDSAKTNVSGKTGYF
jgi:hypothetical protein